MSAKAEKYKRLSLLVRRNFRPDDAALTAVAALEAIREIPSVGSQAAATPRAFIFQLAIFRLPNEIAKLDQLKKAGSITDEEFARLRAKLVQ